MSFANLRIASPIGLARLVLVCAAVLGIVGGNTIPAFAAGGQTGNLTGTVLDGQTKAPVANATVQLSSPSGSVTVRTDAQGHFTALGLNVDTYTLSVQAPGYNPFLQQGVTVTGDQTIELGTITIARALREIGRVTARSASSAFQPKQTVDSYTVSGARVDQALGKAASFNENQLLLSVPGASTTDTGRVTIRGALATEVGYQLDGVPFTEPFFSTNASNGRFNGLGALQVVEGAGDATQGNIGGGVVNIVPKRGSSPPFGLIDLEAGGPNFSHQAAFEYGFATPNGRFSDYISYAGQRTVPYYGFYNSNVAATGNYFSTSYQANDDILNNLVYRFGRDNHESLQFLVDYRDLQDWGEAGGTKGLQYYLYDPYVNANNLLGAPGILNLFSPNPSKTFGLTPYTPATEPATVGKQIVGWNPTNFLKVEYDNNLNSSTFLALRYYNWATRQGFSNIIDGSSNPSVSIVGGGRSGVRSELTHSFGISHTTTLSLNYENQTPVWDDYAPLESTINMLVGNGPSFCDFQAGNNPSAPCSGPGYVYSHYPHLRIPVDGIGYNQAIFHEYGVGLRDQWSVSPKLKLDYGVRIDGAKYDFGRNPFNPNLGNPSDVDPSFLKASFLHPNFTQPRVAAAYQFGPDDAVRFGYGRSVELLNAQTAGTPAALYGANPLFNLPPVPGTNTSNPATWTCGSGLNTANLLPSKANMGPKGGGFFRCANYAQQFFWAYDQNLDAPDLGNGQAPQYSNTDLTYTHQFKNGWGARLTGFYKSAQGLPGFFILSQKVDPNTGAILYQVFSISNNAINKTSGLEFSVTTPDRPYGITGYLSTTYQNVLSSVPPLINGEDQLPLVNDSVFALGDLYRAGFVSPFSARLGATYKTQSGWRFNPDLDFNLGFPFGAGQLIAPSGLINGAYYNIAQSNWGIAAPSAIGYNATTGAAIATQYVDPAYPGSYLRPNIAATRGTAETSAAGGQLSKPTLNANMTIEYTRHRNTFGVQLINLLGNVYNGNTPEINSYYQPVTTGVAGPATGIPQQSNPAQNSPGVNYQLHGFAPVPGNAFGSNPYVLLPNIPFNFRVYFQRSL